MKYSRRDNLVISGIPAILSEVASATGTQEIEYSSTSVNKVIAFCKDVLHVDVESSEISPAHRLRAGRNSAHPPLLVRFTRRIMRDDVLRAARDKLKPSTPIVLVMIVYLLTKTWWTIRANC